MQPHQELIWYLKFKLIDLGIFEFYNPKDSEKSKSVSRTSMFLRRASIIQQNTMQKIVDLLVMKAELILVISNV